MHKLIQIIKDPDLRYSVVVVLLWRIIVEGYAIFALNRFPMGETITHKFYPLIIWTNWDAGHFMRLATQGYFTSIQYAFFPLYPLLIHLVSWPAVELLGSRVSIYIVAGLIINLLALIGAGYFLIKLARLANLVEDGKRALLLLLFSPAAIFLAALYSEPLFLLWIIGAFYFSRTKHWLWAGVFGSLAALTRQVGFLLLVPLLIEFVIIYRGEIRNNWRRGLWLFLTPLGLFVYMVYQYARTGNWFEFSSVQIEWHRQLSLHAPIDVFNQMIIALDPRLFNPGATGPFYDSMATIIFVAVAIVLLIRRQVAYAVLVLLLIAAPLASGQVYGMIRYTLVIFPAFLLFGRWGRNPSIFAVLLATFALFFALLSIHFINGLWLA